MKTKENGMKYWMVGIGLAAFLSMNMVGCSQIIGEITTLARNDFARTVELADKYGKPEVKQCFVFLGTALDSLDKDSDSLDALLAEKTAGITSAGLKAVLIKEHIQSLNDPVKQAKFEKDFNDQCGKLSGQIVLNLIKDARNSAKRLPGRL